MKTKVCTKCHKRKKLFEFHKDKNRKDNYFPICKKCISNYQKEYYLKNKDRIKKTVKKWREAHKEYYKEFDKKYYQEHKKRMNKNSKEYRKLNPWQGHHHHAEQRCNNSNHDKYKYYGGKGIKMLMTSKDFKSLWFRDKAYLLKRPSIDRINNDGNYTLKNCQFIELSENTSKARRGK